MSPTPPLFCIGDLPSKFSPFHAREGDSRSNGGGLVQVDRCDTGAFPGVGPCVPSTQGGPIEPTVVERAERRSRGSWRSSLPWMRFDRLPFGCDNTAAR